MNERILFFLMHILEIIFSYAVSFMRYLKKKKSLKWDHVLQVSTAVAAITRSRSEVITIIRHQKQTERENVPIYWEASGLISASQFWRSVVLYSCNVLFLEFLLTSPPPVLQFLYHSNLRNRCSVTCSNGHLSFFSVFPCVYIRYISYRWSVSLN